MHALVTPPGSDSQRLHNSSDYIKWFTEQIKCHELGEEKGWYEWKENEKQ